MGIGQHIRTPGVKVVSGQTTLATVESWLIEDRQAQKIHCLFWLGLADVTPILCIPGSGSIQQGFDEALALCIPNIFPLPAINLVPRLTQISKCISLRLYLRAAIPYPKQESVRVCQNQGPRDGISRIGPTRPDSKARRLGNRPTVHFPPSAQPLHPPGGAPVNLISAILYRALAPHHGDIPHPSLSESTDCNVDSMQHRDQQLAAGHVGQVCHQGTASAGRHVNPTDSHSPSESRTPIAVRLQENTSSGSKSNPLETSLCHLVSVMITLTTTTTTQPTADFNCNRFFERRTYIHAGSGVVEEGRTLEYTHPAGIHPSKPHSPSPITTTSPTASL